METDLCAVMVMLINFINQLYLHKASKAVHRGDKKYME